VKFRAVATTVARSGAADAARERRILSGCFLFLPPLIFLAVDTSLSFTCPRRFAARSPKNGD
jgi:hypothetical protein